MRLTDLEPQFINAHVSESKPTTYEHSDSIEADGIMFGCPKCNGNSMVGTHRIVCWRPRVPQSPT
jgi:hypothetical protein